MPSPPATSPGAVKAGAAYFAVVFCVGFALGILRVLVTAPRLGETGAVLLEAPVILTASWFVARGCIAAFAVPPARRPRLTMGAVALALTLIAELALSVLLFGRTPAEHLATYVHPAGYIGLAAQIAFALIPYAQGELQ